jgi:hypothetical protein
MRIAIELEAPGDSRTMFRVLVGDKIIADGLMSAQAHILVGDILERLALPKEPSESDVQRSSRHSVITRVGSPGVKIERPSMGLSQHGHGVRLRKGRP